MKIRWKLFLSLFLLTTVVTVLLLVVAEREFRGWVGKQVTESFSRRVDALLLGRKTRLEGVRETTAKLATHSAVSDTLLGKSTAQERKDFLNSYQELRAEILPKRESATPPESKRPQDKQLKAIRAPGVFDRQLPLMGVVNLKNELQFFGQSPAIRTELRRESASRRLELMESTDEQVISYVVMDDVGTPGRIREVVVSPVFDGTMRIGWFFLGVNAEATVERAFQEIEDLNAQGVRTGLVVGNEWVVEGINPGILTKFANIVDEGFWSDRQPDIVQVDGNEYLLVARDLNPGSPLGKGYQVGIFPLENVIAAVRHLRWIVSAMAAGALFVTGIFALFLARRFSRPIDELIKGTIRVREGDFQSLITIDSKDEFGTLAASFNEMTRDLGLKEKYHDLLGKTSDPGLVKSLLDGKIELGGEIRQAAVLFCDIRGFTAMTDGLNPAEVIDLLNDHMMAMTKVIHEHGGIVDKFVGDLVMAVFGVPVGREGDLQRAISCAIAMQDERERLNHIGSPVIETGIGITWGELVAGLMGSSERMNYTVLGERVNLAARLCSAAGPGEVITDRATVEASGDSAGFELRREMPMKGFRVPVEVWCARRKS